MIAWIWLACADADPCALDAPVSTIDDVVELLDQLPAPVTIECALTALERPLGVTFTSDVFNTQPAQGYRSPRILVRTEGLALTAVPVGEARRLLELGEAHEDGLTVKAEIEFPVDGPVDPFTRTLAFPDAEETGCRVCHADEVALGGGRFANTELRPPDGMVVPLALVQEEHAACDPAEDADRCAMFSALFDHGEVVESRFPDSVATQFLPSP
jgi:hypothetical protein